MSEELLTSSEVASLLRVHPKHLYRLLRQGLPGHRHGRGHWRFRREEVLAWIDQREATDESVVAELPVAGSDPGSMSRRVVLGRVGERWVAHALGPDSRRSADGLTETPAAPGHVRTSVLAPLRSLEANVLVAGCAPVLGLVLDRVERDGPGRAHWIPGNSTAALTQLMQGQVHIAGIHLEDRDTGADHEALVRQRLGTSARLVRLVRWHAGLALAPTLTGCSLASLIDRSVRWVQREPGAGSHAVLTRALRQQGVEPSALSITHRADDHEGVARAVALGIADVGVCIEPVVRAWGLGFLPLQEEGFDLVVTAEGLARPAVARLLQALDDPHLRREVAAIGSYDASALGHGSTA